MLEGESVRDLKHFRKDMRQIHKFSSSATMLMALRNKKYIMKYLSFNHENA